MEMGFCNKLCWENVIPLPTPLPTLQDPPSSIALGFFVTFYLFALKWKFVIYCREIRVNNIIWICNYLWIKYHTIFFLLSWGFKVFIVTEFSVKKCISSTEIYMFSMFFSLTHILILTLILIVILTTTPLNLIRWSTWDKARNDRCKLSSLAPSWQRSFKNSRVV